MATKPPIEWPSTTSGPLLMASMTAAQSSACLDIPTGPGSRYLPGASTRQAIPAEATARRAEASSAASDGWR